MEGNYDLKEAIVDVLGITGATGGIGKACVAAAVGRGYRVVPICARLDAECTEDSKRTARLLRTELASAAPDCLIYAAGVNRLSWIGATSPKDAWETFSVNLLSFYETINQAVGLGIGPMRVVAIGSDAGKVPMRCSSLYCASKAALSHMVKVMARELAPKGWRINCVAPGLVAGTAMTEEVYRQVTVLRGWTEDELTRNMLSMIPDGRSADPDEVARVAMFLLGDDARHINGETVGVTGGK